LRIIRCLLGQSRLSNKLIFFIQEPQLIAKSIIKLGVSPWDDETDLVEMEKLVRSIEMEGLVWGTCEY
jgi:hypothetical protein